MIQKFHNLPKDVKKSIAEQSKLASWISGAINGYFAHPTNGEIWIGIFIVVWWIVFQFIAHYIIYTVSKE